jgi:hypothetical protein
LCLLFVFLLIKLFKKYMSKTLLSIFGIAIVTVIIVGYSFLYKDKGVNPTSGGSTAFLYVEEGDVSYKMAHMTSFAKATTSPVQIGSYTQVHTGLGKAVVILPNNSTVELDKYTELTVNYDAGDISLIQTLGTTYHRVEAMITGTTYQVRTPGTLAAVRGTKFAVEYEKQTKTTKVAVTEHQVLVSKLKENGDATGDALDSVFVNEGKTVRVHATAQSTSTARFDVVGTETDIDMETFVEQSEKNEARIEEIKKEIAPIKGGTDREIEETLSNIRKGIDMPPQSREAPKDGAPTAPVQPKKTTEFKTDTKETKPAIIPLRDAATPTEIVPVKKIDEEAFFDVFNNMFATYFYLDDKDATCNLSVTPNERVRIVSSYASESGYPISSTTLSSFAVALQAYCDRKDAVVKASLQARFDAEYPFKESI